TRFSRDWSSDVCSSDPDKVSNSMAIGFIKKMFSFGKKEVEEKPVDQPTDTDELSPPPSALSEDDTPPIAPADPEPESQNQSVSRSEERRVGKESSTKRT